jgi:hypothetical protein
MTPDDLTGCPPPDLFDLASWPHRELFAGCAAAWEVLGRLPEYLESVLRPGIRGEVEAGAISVPASRSPTARTSRQAPKSAALRSSGPVARSGTGPISAGWY